MSYGLLFAILVVKFIIGIPGMALNAVGLGYQSEFKIGDRVGYSSGAIGSYAEANNVVAQKLVKLPDSISDEPVQTIPAPLIVPCCGVVLTVTTDVAIATPQAAVVIV